MWSSSSGCGPHGWRGGSSCHFLQHLPLWIGYWQTKHILWVREWKPFSWAIAMKALWILCGLLTQAKRSFDMNWMGWSNPQCEMSLSCLKIPKINMDMDYHPPLESIKMAWNGYLGYSPIHSMDLASVICRHGLCQVDGGKDMPLAQRWCWMRG